MNYSIVIPSYNSETTIATCLQALVRQEFHEPYEIIVVDSSHDATPKIIQQNFPQVSLIHFSRQTDAGTARNTGIQHARGAILCFIDSDCIADPSWLARMAALHHDGYAAVGGAVLNGNPESLVGWAGYLAEFREYFPFQPGRDVSHIASCNISYDRHIFEQFGPFPPDFYPQEDLVFNQRLTEDGVKIRFDPAIRVSHINRTSPIQFCRHQYRIGRITAEVLRSFPALHGSWLARSRLLTVCAAPLLPLVKFVNTFREIRASPDYRRHFWQVSPLLLFGLLIFWASGFVRGAFLPPRKKNVIR